MTLKATIDTLDSVPEAARSLYAEKDGKFHLTVEGLVPRERLDEFRANNIAFRKERDDLATKFEGIDPDRYRELDERARKDRDRKLIDAGKVDELVAERVTALKADHGKQVQALATREAAATKQLEGLLIDTAIRDGAAKAGVRATAIEDVLLRGRSLFRLQDGRAIPMDGDKPVYGKSGEPMQIDEWIGTLGDRAPHLFEASKGGGAAGANGSPLAAAGRISRGDTAGFLDNLAKIAAGKVAVV